MIDITGVNLVKFVQKVYELSVPQGLGFLHFDSEPLTNEEAKSLIGKKPIYENIILDMDYVRGRACKMHVTQDGKKLFIQDNWYDHTDKQLQQLLDAVGIKHEVGQQEHGCACNCGECQARRKGKYN